MSALSPEMVTRPAASSLVAGVGRSSVIKAPFVPPEFNRLTAIRLCYNPDLGVALMIEPNDVLDGEIWADEKCTKAVRVAPRILDPHEETILSLEVATQGIVLIAAPDWNPECCPPWLMTLGTFNPLDQTDETGVIPLNRRLYWQPALTETKPPARRAEFRLNGKGLMSWSERASTHSIDLSFEVPANGSKTFHLVLLTRDREAGSIRVPALGGQPAIELKL